MPLNLVVQTAFLGDLLLSIPLLKRCKQLWPEHKLALVCRKGLGDFFLKTKLVDQIYEIQKGQQVSYEKIIEQLKSEDIHYLISPHQSLRTAFFCRKIQARHKIAFKNWWSYFVFSEHIQRDSLLPDAIRQLSLLCSPSVPQSENLQGLISQFKEQETPYAVSSEGQLSAPPTWASMSHRDEVLAQVELFEKLKSQFNLIGFEDQSAVLIFPGSVWATKRWTEKGFIESGRRLKETGHSIYIMGGPGEEALAERVASGIPGAISLAGKTTILESAQLIARAGLVVGNDSASTHLASVCETPLVAVFGPTVLEFGYRPWSAESHVVQKENLKCRPCGKHGHHVCPVKTHACMVEISSEEVVSRAQIALKKRPKYS